MINAVEIFSAGPSVRCFFFSFFFYETAPRSQGLSSSRPTGGKMRDRGNEVDEGRRDSFGTRLKKQRVQIPGEFPYEKDGGARHTF